MPHGAEPAHKPKPPEHVKPIEDPSHQRRLNTLAGDFHIRAQVAFDHCRIVRHRGNRSRARSYSWNIYGNFATKPESTASVSMDIGSMPGSALATPTFTGRKASLPN